MSTSNDTSKSVKRGVSVSATLDATNNWGSSNAAMHPRTESLKAEPSLLTLYESASIHDLNGVNVRLQINNAALIKTHESRINKFTRLKQLTEAAKQKDPQSDTITITTNGGEELVDDFLKMFKLLDASLIDQPKHEPNVLVSAARIAAPNAYQYDALYQYCLEKLKELSLNSMERIRVARALNITDWEKDALTELFGRKEMITRDEANTLGMNTYWEIATEREIRNGSKLEGVLQELKDKTKEVRDQTKDIPPRGVFRMLALEILGLLVQIMGCLVEESWLAASVVYMIWMW
ncbi:unnamed protein product [Rhizoctonia solani]|uniref:BTB domain-containing protein n=1 Tax=Rhizoctonia solani TaxID=456999 RepID=A0A8H3A794_9AGAM|nr:unnamed protein product [Rhizoctonia solani]